MAESREALFPPIPASDRPEFGVAGAGVGARILVETIVPRSSQLATGLAAALILAVTLVTGGAGGRAPTAKGAKAKKPATFPHSGTIHIPSTSATASSGASLAPGVLFRSVPPETLDWGPADTTRTMTVSVTDRRGRALTGSLGFPISVPVTFRLTGKPPGVVGAVLVAGAVRDSAAVVVSTSGLRGTAMARLVRGNGIGRYEVTASLPAEFSSLPENFAGTLKFITLTQGTTTELTGLTIEQGHLANGRDSALIDVDAKDFSSLRLVMYFGSPIGAATAQRAKPLENCQ